MVSEKKSIHGNNSSRRLIGVRVQLKKDFVRIEKDKLIVGIKAKPQEGKANEELLRKLARHFKVPVSSVRIVSGRTSKRKVVEIM